MAARKIWFVYDAAGVVMAAYSDEGDALELARYMGFDLDDIGDGGVSEVCLDRPVDEFAVEDEHRA